MTTLPELLKDADPLALEPQQSAEATQRSRQAVLASRVPDEMPRRAMVTAVFVAIGVAAMAAGGVYWSRANVDVMAAVRFEVRLAEDAFSPGLREAGVDGGRKIYLHPEAVITNSDIERAQLVEASGPTYNITVTFKADGARRMRSATEGHIGKPMAILIDGVVVMAPTVRAAIGNVALITGDYSKADAERIVGGIIGR